MSLVFRHSGNIASIKRVKDGYLQLQKRLLGVCLFNLLLLALAGLLLRAYPLFSIDIFSYKNVLHAHSHFAFGGWVMPALFLLILRFFPELATAAAYPHWKRVIILTIVSAYGMLLSFPAQGYTAISIIFSTLSISAGFYAGYLVHRTAPRQFCTSSSSFLKAAFFFFFISSLGPFATGPLIAMGMTGSDIYYNVIYFYLHFQYNGFFTFIVMAVLYRLIEPTRPFNNGRSVFTLLCSACIPAFALSLLWSDPPVIVHMTGGIAAILQLVAIALLLKDISGLRWKNERFTFLFRLAMAAFIVKSILQLLSALPAVAQLAFQNRNFIIAYLHLVLIGFITIFIFSLLPKLGPVYNYRRLNYGILLFLFAFFSTELVLVLQATGTLQRLSGRFYFQLLLTLSIFFPVGSLMIYSSMRDAHSVKRRLK